MDGGSGEGGLDEVEGRGSEENEVREGMDLGRKGRGSEEKGEREGGRELEGGREGRGGVEGGGGGGGGGLDSRGMPASPLLLNRPFGT